MEKTSQPIEQAKTIIFSGLPGAGVSTLTRTLVKESHIVRISVDDEEVKTREDEDRGNFIIERCRSVVEQSQNSQAQFRGNWCDYLSQANNSLSGAIKLLLSEFGRYNPDTAASILKESISNFIKELMARSQSQNKDKILVYDFSAEQLEIFLEKNPNFQGTVVILQSPTEVAFERLMSADPITEKPNFLNNTDMRDLAVKIFGINRYPELNSDRNRQDAAIMLCLEQDSEQRKRLQAKLTELVEQRQKTLSKLRCQHSQKCNFFSIQTEAKTTEDVLHDTKNALGVLLKKPLERRMSQRLLARSESSSFTLTRNDERREVYGRKKDGTNRGRQTKPGTPQYPRPMTRSHTVL
jgi:adenylate kinase family enzyme